MDRIRAAVGAPLLVATPPQQVRDVAAAGCRRPGAVQASRVAGEIAAVLVGGVLPEQAPLLGPAVLEERLDQTLNATGAAGASPPMISRARVLASASGTAG